MESRLSLRVHRSVPRGSGSRLSARGVGEQLGRAQLLAPQLAQVEPPLDALLNRVPHRADDLVLVTGDEERPRVVDVVRLRPCLVDFDEACRVAAENDAADLFLPSDTMMVALELAHPLAIGAPAHLSIGSMDLVQLGSSWLCKIFCVSSCKSC